MYNSKVIEIFLNPNNVGTIKGASGIATVGDDACGDITKLYLKVNNRSIITDAKFKTFGCVGAIASSAVATELIIGKSIEEALDLNSKDILKELGGLPLHKEYCSLLAIKAIEKSIKDFKKKQLRNKKLSQKK